MKYQILREKNLIIETFSGRVTQDDAVSFLKEILEDPDYSQELNGIADFREADLDVSYGEIQGLVDWLASRETRAKGYWAFVTDRPITHGISRIFAALAEGLQRQIEYFDSPEQAARWLDEVCRRSGE